jgi:preprotein translocase subunit SecD
VIKGFAVTLTIGILVSIFSSMIVTRYLMKTFIKVPKWEKHLGWFGAKNRE